MNRDGQLRLLVLGDPTHQPDVRRKGEVGDAVREGAVLSRASEKMPVPLQCAVSWFVNNTGDMLFRINQVVGSSTPLKPGAKPVDARQELGFVVESGYDHVSTLTAHRVVSVVPNNEPQNRVITRVYLGHMSKTQARKETGRADWSDAEYPARWMPMNLATVARTLRLAKVLHRYFGKHHERWEAHFAAPAGHP